MNRRTSHGLRIGLLALASLAAAGRDLRLVDAARRNDSSAARALLREQIDVNARSPDGSTALIWAAYHDNPEMAGLLIAAGADVNAANEYGERPLSVACQNRDATLAARLLKAGADPNAAKPGGETTLMAVTDTGSLELVKLLIAHGANVNARETLKGQTALMWAAVRGDLPVAEALLSAGADIHAVSNAGSTPLHFAVQQGGVAVARRLLEAGADPNVPMTARQIDQEAQPFAETLVNVTPLWLAITIRSDEAGVLLLEYGADPNAGQYRNIPPLHLAVQARMIDLTKALLVYGADPNARAPESARPPKDADENLIGHKSFYLMPVGATAFLVAAQIRDTELMRTLLAAGANPQLSADDKTTPLMAAAGVADDRYRAAGPKQRASAQELLAAATLAVEHGGDVNAVNTIGQTALHGAVGVRSSEVTKLLLDHGADVDIADDNGQTPLDLAERARARSIIEILKREPQTAAGR